MALGVSLVAESLPNAKENVLDAWASFGDTRSITSFDEVSAHVSTNRVFRITLSDNSRLIAKVSSYGSFFQFAEDHDRLARCSSLLRGGRWSGFLAEVLTKNGRPFTWYDGACWAVFYTDVQGDTGLPRILEDADVVSLATEIAEFHLACAAISPSLPPTSNSIKGDAIHLYDLLRDDQAASHFGLDSLSITTLQRYTHDLLLHLEKVHYDEWTRIPILVDWNLGNFSVRPNPQHGGSSFEFSTRWDYDWFRIESRLLDFYFLSRVSSRTGDKTQFSYSAHTLTEPRFVKFIAAYHQVYPLSKTEIEFLPFAYRFFILNYVIREGARFFRPDLCAQFRRDAAHHYLVESERLDLTQLLNVVG
ncbi:MAG: hypothetical protein O3A62_01255 [Actinomycetota bacterium]|nr:hypothetical protein [Actinomycetota bacterium]MDA3003683.1 hypothetical protein [Actinomycetota bacterium]